MTWPQLSSLDDVELVNKGAVAEQLVGQHLFFSKGCFEEPRLNYWLREGGKNNAEVDFVIDRDAAVLPVEVKAGSTGSLKALRQMMVDKRLKRAVRFDAGRFSRQEVRTSDGSAYELVTLPIYAVQLL